MCLWAKRKYFGQQVIQEDCYNSKKKIQGMENKKKGFWSFADMSDFVLSFMEPICCAITQMKFQRKFFVQRSIVFLFYFNPSHFFVLDSKALWNCLLLGNK